MNTANNPMTTMDASLDELRAFVEDEADLLDTQQFDAWLELFAEDAVYWVPAVADQENWVDHVSLFFDDKHTLKTRVQRLNHPMLHCQTPPSRTVRVLSNFRLQSSEGLLATVTTKFVMIEDRPGAEQRLFAGRYTHTLRRTGNGLEIVRKRVDLTNCDQSFPMLTQPF